MANRHSISISARIQDLTGNVFGHLTVVSFTGLNRYKKAMWHCRCDCGNVKEVIGAHLKSGNTLSCGECYRFMSELEYESLVRSRMLSAVVVSASGCWEYPHGVNQSGYRHATWRGASVRAHILSYKLFCGPVPEGLCVLHACDNPSCCYPLHLRVGTHKENTADMIEKGRHAFGERHGSVKLTADKVCQIRELGAVGGLSQSAIAARFGVSRSTVQLILSGKRWKHLPT